MRQVAAGFQEGTGDTFHGGRRRIIGDKMPHELGGDEVRGRWMTSQIREHGLTLPLTLLVVGFAEKGFGARFVKVFAEVKTAGNPAGEPPLAAADRPSRDDLGKGGDIILRVAAVDAQRMQFENFASQVLIDAELALGFVGRALPGLAPRRELRQLGILADRILIVEKADHCGVLLYRGQQVDESAIDVRSDRLVLQRAGDAENRALVC
jgi:hypothetical protein